jgi:hypothetical protein
VTQPVDQHSLGTVFLSASPGTPVGRFDFVVDTKTGTTIEIGTLVTAVTAEGNIVGSVVDMRTIGHDKDPTLVEMTAPRHGGAEPLVPSPDVMLATVQVFFSPAMRPARPGYVRAATAEEVLEATGYNKMSWPIPAGVVPLVTSPGEAPRYAKVHLDGELLLGPEAVSLNVGGLTGAAKTSFASVLLSSILQSSRRDHTVGAVIFNVKGTDLIYLDKEPEKGYEISDDDRAMYDVLGVQPRPFQNVTVYAPGLPSGGGARSPRADAVPLRWDLKEVWPDIRMLLNVPYDDEKLNSFLYEFQDLMLNATHNRVDTFAKLANWIQTCIDECGDDSMAWRSHHVMTMRRINRMLNALPYRAGGLLSQEKARPGEDIPVVGWNDGKVIVIDLEGFETDVQGMVIGRTIKRIMNAASDGTLGVDHMVIMADELNKFAPSQGSTSSTIKHALAQTSSQGRYAGVALFGLAQRLSAVDPAVIQNAATRAIGVSDEVELATGMYGKLPAGLAERLATLPKGQMALWHQAFRSATVVKFPRPAWQTGKSKTTAGSRPTSISSLGLASASAERLTEGLESEDIDRIMTKHDDPADALAALQLAREPDMAKTALHAPSTFDHNNPYALSDD